MYAHTYISRYIYIYIHTLYFKGNFISKPIRNHKQAILRQSWERRIPSAGIYSIQKISATSIACFIHRSLLTSFVHYLIHLQKEHRLEPL